MKTFKDLKVSLDEDLAEKLSYLAPGFSEFRIIKQSVDARQRHNPHFVMTLEVADRGEKLPQSKIEVEKISKLPLNFKKPIIIGSGPAGLFAALRLVERGIPCVLFERGSESAERVKGINRFWRYGELDPRNNVCFGEGGAGLYSDGKLITRIKSPHIPYVLDRLVQFGAPSEITYLSNPHVGSDRLRRVIPFLRDFLKTHGCEIHFNTQVTEFLTSGKSVIGMKTENNQEYFSDHIVVATGHSAEDILFQMLEKGIFMEGKSFAMGLRIEHPQSLINQIQYREAWQHPKLGAANYKLADHDADSGIGVYSFCMCPGGYVLSSGTEADALVCNGMSNFKRNSPFANAAIVVSIDHEKNFGSDLLGGLKLRKKLEKHAFESVQQAGGNKQLPGQMLVDFMQKKSSKVIPGSSPSGVIATRLDQLLPDFMYSRIKKSLEKFDRNMKGFISENVQLYGVESRTSCPLRVTRDEVTLQSVSHAGLYPCGEGAGYAGGITSAACDGIRVAEAIVSNLS